jgi:hypothetical protein
VGPEQREVTEEVSQVFQILYREDEERLTADVERSADSPYGNRQCRNKFISVPNCNASGIDEYLNSNYHYGGLQYIRAKDNQERSSSRRRIEKRLKER